ncbi:MAG: hypothetical protein KGH49_00445 [Candidatus Micrarchaeota archaeon]|nr:hypothetical protein [Candidatus Micrarchaeota archaeon]
MTNFVTVRDKQSESKSQQKVDTKALTDTLLHSNDYSKKVSTINLLEKDNMLDGPVAVILSSAFSKEIRSKKPSFWLLENIAAAIHSSNTSTDYKREQLSKFSEQLSTLPDSMSSRLKNEIDSTLLKKQQRK